ncbi:MAG: DNA mismatch repair protein MutS [Pseudomonadota bacterium]
MAVADSPVMRQYGEIKAQYPAALVMFRMGDFYELFAEDAVTAAGVLQITLTRRRTAQASDAGVPMCGVPFHAAEGYIGKLLAQGYTVALAEQLETPEAAKKRGGSSLVKRGVVRLYTPGTLTEEAYLEAKRPTLLCAVGLHPTDTQRLALAWLDMSTGEVGVRGVGAAQLVAVLASMPIGELVVHNLPAGVEAVLPRRVVQVQPHLFAPSTAEAALARAYQGAALQGLGFDDPARIIAAGALLGYAELTQMGKLPPLRAPRIALPSSHLHLDIATRKSLDILESPSGQRADTLLGILDDTTTSAGARLLARWLSEPLAQLEPLLARQHAVKTLMHNNRQRHALRQALQPTGDVARAISRVLLGRGSPRDLGTLRATGQAAPMVMEALHAAEGLLAHHAQQLAGLPEITALLTRALAPDPLPALVREGGFVAAGFDAELDTLRHLQTHAHELLCALEQREAAATSLNPKLRYNQVWGYYLEVGKAAGNPPSHWVHRQTTTNTHRYSTPELLQLERDVANAAVQAQAREEQVLAELLEALRATTDAWLAASEGLATLDVLATLAEVAVRNAWILPILSDEGTLKLSGAKHPVVAAKRPDFVANSVTLNAGDVWLLTGPNMAGKSTFLRQTALLVVLAQIGSAVPAAQAQVALCDAIFCRVGAADNLAAGQSTCMVEMLETANILNRATSRSLVILDELGRGTATYDGLAIAWAATEALTQRIKARTLFATHYHELTALTETLPQLSNHQLAVKVWQNELVFLHEVKPGAAEGSYGVQVAKLAGVPPEVVQRAQQLLQGFESSAKGNVAGGVARVNDLSLFTAPLATEVPQISVAEGLLRATDIDGLSPREALQLLYDLKAKVLPQQAPTALNLKAVV